MPTLWGPMGLLWLRCETYGDLWGAVAAVQLYGDLCFHGANPWVSLAAVQPSVWVVWLRCGTYRDRWDAVAAVWDLWGEFVGL